MMSSQVISFVVPPPEPELPEPEPPDPELDEPEPDEPEPELPEPEPPDPELLALLVDVLWIFHSPFWRRTSIFVVPWIAFSLRSQTSLFGFSEYSPPVGRALFAGSNGSSTTSNCMILPVLSKSVELGTPRLSSWIFVPFVYLEKSMTIS